MPHTTPPKSAAARLYCPYSRPLQNQASTGDTKTLKGRSHSVSVESLCPGAHRVLSEPSRHL